MPEDTGVVSDDRLRLIFTCCHPALSTQAQVALTLRLLGGLSTMQVARAFLVAEATMARRLVRAKHKIKAARIPYRIPADHELPSRLRPLASPLVGEAQEARAVMSTINRNSETHQPASTRQASTGSAHQGASSPCQRFARNRATCNRVTPHDTTVGSTFHLRGCVGTRGSERRREPPAHRW